MKKHRSLLQVRPYVHDRYRKLPIFGRFLDGFVPWAANRGYTIHSIHLQLDAVRHLDAWFRRRGHRTAKDLSEADVTAAHHTFAKRRRDPRYAWGLRGFVSYLRANGWLKAAPPQPLTRCEREVNRFVEHLGKDRGAADSTCEGSRRRIRHFLDFLGLNRDERALQDLTLALVDRYLRSVADRYQRKTMQHVVGSVRGFLRFQFMRRVIRAPLHLQIDTVRARHDETLPQPVKWSELQELLGRIDRSTPLGLRDYAVLVLAATYGLRASDVANLTFDAVDWRQRQIRLVQCKTRQPLVLPLTDEVGTALADYIRQARPDSSSRHIFLRWRAPVEPLSLPGMSHTLRRASRSTGVKLDAVGFRCLRHAVALRLLRQGTSLKGIGDILGHRSPVSTSTYLRLDVEDLRQVALPVPTTTGNEPSRKAPKSSPSKRWRKGSRTAPASWSWRSCLGKSMRDYVATQRALGREYETQERTLRGLDYFLVRHSPRAKRLTASIFKAWASGLHSLCPTTARMRMLCVRKFCCHLAHSQPGTFIPDLRTFPKEVPHQAPYLLSESEVARTLKATEILRSTRSNPLHPRTIRLSFLLMFCCGLRHGEVLKLQLADIDTEQMVLRILETKFNKSRLVPMAPSVAAEVRQYLRDRHESNMPGEPSAPLVWNGYPRRNDRTLPMTPSPFWTTWQRVCRSAGVFDHRGRPPRLHDLRHSYAVEALRRGYSTGQNAQAVLPRLALYMGHAGARFTHYYLKFTEPLRCVANDRFRQNLATAVLVPADHVDGGAR